MAHVDTCSSQVEKLYLSANSFLAAYAQGREASLAIFAIQQSEHVPAVLFGGEMEGAS